MHNCPGCGRKLNWRFVAAMQKWRPIRECPDCGERLTHSGLLKSGSLGAVIGLLGFVAVKNSIGTASAFIGLLILLVLSWGLGILSVRVMRADPELEESILQSIRIGKMSVVVALLAIVGGAVLAVVGVFGAVLAYDRGSLGGVAVFGATGVLGVLVVAMGIRMRSGKGVVAIGSPRQ